MMNDTNVSSHFGKTSCVAHIN